MGWLLITVLLIIYAVACAFLIFVILIQSGKGGGLSSLGSASQGLSDSLGATGAEKTLNKLTTGSAVLFMVIAIALSLVSNRTIGAAKHGKFLKEKSTEAPINQPLPAGAQGMKVPMGKGARPVRMPKGAPVAPAAAQPVKPAPAK